MKCEFLQWKRDDYAMRAGVRGMRVGVKEMWKEKRHDKERIGMWVERERDPMHGKRSGDACKKVMG